MHGNKRPSSLCGVIASLLLTGCGGSEIHTVPAIGRVTLGGQSVGGAVIGFALVDGIEAYNAYTDANGAFSMRYSNSIEGIPPGEYRVSVRSLSDLAPYGLGLPAGHIPGQPIKRENRKKIPSMVPYRYHDSTKSGLTASVEEDGDNDFVFALQSK
ncbi:MAG: carboxypeptidase-like regulatory domain-containing protein [Pirellulales bacterium]|nr:carboxypeptidase-like regulatory domain-containing protein [Pirellulales bacterium]